MDWRQAARRNVSNNRWPSSSSSRIPMVILWHCRIASRARRAGALDRELNVTGLGHVLLTVKDTQRSHDFYTGVLGFRLSDWVCIDDQIRLCFLRCNARHHSIAFAPCMPGKFSRLQHVMLEVGSLDDVLRSITSCDPRSAHRHGTRPASQLSDHTCLCANPGGICRGWLGPSPARRLGP